MPIVTWCCLFLLVPVAVSGLAVMMTMKEGGMRDVPMMLILKVWGLCLLFAVPLGTIVGLMMRH